MIITTEAVVLKARRYSESSKIIVLYTRQRGKLSAIAKGALRGRGRFGSSLDVLSHVTAVLYVKEERELQVLSECDLFEPFRTLSQDAEKMAAAMGCVELLHAATHPEERSEALFSLLVRVLAAADRATKRAGNTLYYFEMGLLDVLGFKPILHSCVSCGAAVGDDPAGGGMHLSEDGVICRQCLRKHHGLFTLSRPAFRVLQRLQELKEPLAVTRWSLSDPVRAEIGATLRRLLQHHIEGLGPLKSEQVFGAFPVSRS